MIFYVRSNKPGAIGGNSMEDREMEYSDSLISDRNFIYNLGQRFREEESNTQSRIERFSLLGRLAIPSFFCGYLVNQAQYANSNILSFLFIAISCVLAFFAFFSAYDFYKKESEDIFFYYILPNELKNHILNEKNSEQKKCISDVFDIADEAFEITDNIRYRKAIPKTDWDSLYAVLYKSKKIYRNYNETLYYDDLAYRLSKDLVFRMKILNKIK
jgi:hypothetical protein